MRVIGDNRMIELSISAHDLVRWLEAYQYTTHHIEPSVWMTYVPWQIRYHSSEGRMLTLTLDWSLRRKLVIVALEYPPEHREYVKELLGHIVAQFGVE